MVDVKNLDLELKSLAIFRGLAEGPVLSELAALISAGELPEAERVERWARFAEELYREGGNLADCLLRLVLEDDNVYVDAKARGEAGYLEECLISELDILERVSKLTPEDLRAYIGYGGYLPVWDTRKVDFKAAYSDRIKAMGTKGYGVFARSHMLRLKDGDIVPITAHDPVRFSDLKGYERQRSAVVDNTVALLEGRPAANALLYGDAGTGKSATVKAIANEFAERGLRLIEVEKKQFRDIPEMVARLGESPLKFILFIDDLSFALENDDFYALKVVLEGSAAAKAPNIAVYATSNRRHLIRESFSDRQGDDVHRDETIQETVSLSARFGLTVGFFRPNKKLYLRIVRELAQQYGVKMGTEGIELEAERFASMGRSPRTAKQFIEHLISSGE